MPVPPPKILELGTAVALTPLKVTLVIFAFVELLFSQATPMITIRSAPLPKACDQERDDTGAVDAVRLDALNEIEAVAVVDRPHRTTPNSATSMRVNRDVDTSRLPILDILSPPRVESV